MNRRKTSKKRDFSFNDMPIHELSGAAKPIVRKSGSTLRDKDLIAKALWECLVDNDIESFKDILRTHLEVVNKESFVKKTGISRRTLFRMLSPEGNPTLENISKIIHNLCA